MYFILTFFLGSAIGSFINVLIDRSIRGTDWVAGRSHCDYCHKNLSWFDMVPILSYLLYRGKSRCCHKKLSPRYLFVESLLGTLFVWWLSVGFVFFRLAHSPLTVIQPMFWLTTGIILTVMALADLFYGVVLMPSVWLGSTVVLLYRMVLLHYGVYQFDDFINAVFTAIGAFGFFWSLYKITKGQGMAEGDMYVAWYVALLLGYPKGILAIMLSFVSGALVGILLIGLKIRTRKQTLPFVPFMVAGTVITLVFGEQIIRFLS